MGSANNGYKSQTKEKSLTTCSEKKAMGHQLNFSGTGRLKTIITNIISKYKVTTCNTQVRH